MTYEEFNEAFQERIKLGTERLKEAFSNLDPNSDTYFRDLNSVVNLEKEVTNDAKAYSDFMANNDRYDLEDRRNRIEEERNKNEKMGNWLKFGIGAAGIATTLLTFFAGERYQNQRIDKVSRFEDNDAILKSSDRIVVQDGLRSKGKLGGFLSNVTNLFK